MTEKSEKSQELLKTLAHAFGYTVQAWHTAYNNYHAVPWYRLRRKLQLRRKMKTAAGMLAAVMELHILVTPRVGSPRVQGREPAEGAVAEKEPATATVSKTQEDDAAS